MEEEAVSARAGAKCFYTNRRAAKKCSSNVGVRFCPRPCAHKVQVKYAIPVTDCAALAADSEDSDSDPPDSELELA